MKHCVLLESLISGKRHMADETSGGADRHRLSPNTFTQIT